MDLIAIVHKLAANFHYAPIFRYSDDGPCEWIATLQTFGIILLVHGRRMLVFVVG